MTYRINEIFYSIQGEGYWTGRPAVFCRFSGCNLWNGVEEDRAAAICTFCDTNFVDFEEYSLEQLVTEITLRWPGGGIPMVVFTGGEPTLQLDADLTNTLRDQGWYVAVETNGTQPITIAVDWVCVSPKTRTIRTDCDELKLVYPQRRITPEMFEVVDADHFWLSPMDGPHLADNTTQAYRYCLDHPLWRLNTQLHKTIGVR
jgi:7-carboxy-7-deazaguanine synthase (Cx14CxxC type)